MSQHEVMPHSCLEANTLVGLHSTSGKPLCLCPLPTMWMLQQSDSCCQVESENKALLPEPVNTGPNLSFSVQACSTSVLQENTNRNIFISHRWPHLSCALHFEFLEAGWFFSSSRTQPALPYNLTVLPGSRLGSLLRNAGPTNHVASNVAPKQINLLRVSGW